MSKLAAIAVAAAGAAALAGTAVASPAANPAAGTHVMSVPLPDGSVARVEYVGSIAPKVTVSPAPMADADAPFAMPFPSFAGFDRMIADMNRRSEDMIRQARQMARQPAAANGAVPYVASYGSGPSGATSTTVVSFSNGGSTCTRTTEVVSKGAGKPPKVTSNVSGQCAPDSGAAPPPADRT